MRRALILASTSKYRRELLTRLRVPFEARPPHVDEHILPNEAPEAAAVRLARAKAEAIARGSDAIVIGSDQIAALDGRILRKPGGHHAALEQLDACRGRTVRFFTAAAVIDGRSGRRWQTVDVT